MTDHAGEDQKIRYGVYCKNLHWFYRHYQHDAPEMGPFTTQNAAMKALLNELGFQVGNEP